MKRQDIARLIACGCAAITAQAADPELVREVSSVRVALARNNEALRQYTWREHTEVLIKGDVKNTSVSNCRYDGWGQVQKKPMAGDAAPNDAALAKSNRPLKRKKADMQDYIERAVSLVHTYLPPKPDRIQFLLQNGDATLAKSASGASEVQFRKYWKDGDTLTFTYEPESKLLLKVSVKSYLADPKDPITLEAVFAKLPDGTNHLASAVLTGEAKKIQVKTQNVLYQKASAQ